MTDNTWPTVDTELIDDVTLYSAKLIIPVTGPVIIDGAVAILPVLLHLRRAQDAVLKALKQTGVTRGIAHAFNGSRQQAEGFIRQGFKLGFGGAMTWPRALNLQRLAADLPLEAIVLETDSPDMPPAWRAGQRNEPAELARIAQVLAGLRGITVEEVAAATSANARAVLGL